jgi:hypothetical protein
MYIFHRLIKRLGMGRKQVQGTFNIRNMYKIFAGKA